MSTDTREFDELVETLTASIMADLATTEGSQRLVDEPASMVIEEAAPSLVDRLLGRLRGRLRVEDPSFEPMSRDADQ